MDGASVEARLFFQELAEIYGGWPEEVLTDGGSWYEVGLFGLPRIREWRVISGEERLASSGTVLRVGSGSS